MPDIQKKIKTLEEKLSQLQTQDEQDEFIYGVTNRAGRSPREKIKDFFIDHSTVSRKEKAYFFELAATMLRAGIAIQRAMILLQSKTESQRLRRIIATIRYDLEHGRSFAQTLDRFPDIFDESQRGIIRSAEAVGNLEHVLFKIAANLIRHDALVSRLQSALMYPVAVMIALAVSVSVILTVVVPRMQSIFSGNDLTLPLATRILLGVSLWFLQYFWILGVVALFAVIGFHIYMSSDEGRFSWDFHKLTWPLFGRLARKVLVLRFVENLGLLLESGLPINTTLEYVARSMGNEVYRLKTFDALGAVVSGQSLSSSLAASPFLFPATVVNMLAIGEKSASVGEVSLKIGEYYQREIDATLSNMTTILGPLLVLVIGAAVAFFALAILSPIFSLTQVVG